MEFREIDMAHNRKQEGYDAEFWDPVIKAAEGSDLKRTKERSTTWTY